MFAFASTDIAILILRATVGMFFLLSGFNKLTNRGRHADLVKTLKEDKVPFIPFMQWWVPGWEFVGGALVLVGLGTPFAAGVLSIIMCVACYSEAGSKVKSYAPINGADTVDDYLYLPEVLYLMMLLAVMSAGPGAYSLDNLFFGVF